MGALAAGFTLLLTFARPDGTLQSVPYQAPTMAECITGIGAAQAIQETLHDHPKWSFKSLSCRIGGGLPAPERST